MMAYIVFHAGVQAQNYKKILYMANLPKDPFMLLSMVNMWLRDGGENLDGMCATRGIDRADLEKRLAEAGFEYIPASNQFR